MSRAVGTRNYPALYKRILTLLKKHPAGLNALTISQELKTNYRTTKQYLRDLEDQERVIGMPGAKTAITYILTDNQ